MLFLQEGYVVLHQLFKICFLTLPTYSFFSLWVVDTEEHCIWWIYLSLSRQTGPLGRFLVLIWCFPMYYLWLLMDGTSSENALVEDVAVTEPFVGSRIQFNIKFKILQYFSYSALTCIITICHCYRDAYYIKTWGK